MSTSTLRSSLGLAALAILAWTAEATEGKSVSSDEANTTITSQRMTVHNQDNKAIFEGAVVLTKGSLVVHSDVMVVFFKPAGRLSAVGLERSNPETPTRSSDLPIVSNRKVSLIEATGRVKIVKEDGQATCRKAVYHEDEDKIILTGEPVAWQNGTRVSGQKITLYLAEDRSVVEGGSQVMIQPGGGQGP
jgi:lipopolysaccharide export system protein LptA